MAAAVHGWMMAAFRLLSRTGRKATRLKGLLQAAEEQPYNPDRVQAYVAELNKHEPGAVLAYVDSSVAMPNAAVVAEYMKALVKTNRIAQYTGDSIVEEGVEHQSLAQLLHELTRKLQGEQADDAHVGATTRRPLHVSVQDPSKQKKKQNYIWASLKALYVWTTLFVVLIAVSFLLGCGMGFGVLGGAVGAVAGLTLEGEALPGITKGAFDDVIRQRSSLKPTQNQAVLPEPVANSTWRLDHIKGCDEAKDELQELVQLLKQPGRLAAMSAHTPKGMLLVGQPGTGKTSLARAVAAEAGVPFFYRAGSAFQNMYVGSGAQSIRSLFAAARQAAPCIVFIDEIDSVGRRRGSGSWQAEADNTLNQLLSELDGFKPSKGMVLLAATNFPEALDSALTRPGRIDRQVYLPLPDVKGRLELLRHYLKDKPQDAEVDLPSIAGRMTGWSGADIANVVNEAALLGVSKNSSHLSSDFISQAMDKVIMGSPRRSLALSPEARNHTAYHEAGHVLVSEYTIGSTPVQKVTIVPHGQALGMAVAVPNGDEVHQNKQQLQAQLDFAMGGRAAQEIAFQGAGVTVGARDDFRQASRLARAMVTEYGMSDKLGLQFLEDTKNQQRGQCESLSSETRNLVDLEVRCMLDDAYLRARQLLVQKPRELGALAQALMSHETLSRSDIRDVLNGSFSRALMISPPLQVEPSPPLTDVACDISDSKTPMRALQTVTFSAGMFGETDDCDTSTCATFKFANNSLL